MFDRISRAAERAAAGVSRRNFFGQLGRGAAAVAAGLGGVLVPAGAASAAGPKCCFSVQYACTKGPCPKHVPGSTVNCRDYGGCPQ